MLKFINRLTGSVMWVAEERKEEYMAAGHRPAAVNSEPEKATKAPNKKKGTK